MVIFDMALWKWLFHSSSFHCVVINLQPIFQIKYLLQMESASDPSWRQRKGHFCALVAIMSSAQPHWTTLPPAGHRRQRTAQLTRNASWWQRLDYFLLPKFLAGAALIQHKGSNGQQGEPADAKNAHQRAAEPRGVCCCNTNRLSYKATALACS